MVFEYMTVMCSYANSWSIKTMYCINMCNDMPIMGLFELSIMHRLGAIVRDFKALSDAGFNRSTLVTLV